MEINTIDCTCAVPSSGTYAEYQPQLAAMLSLEQDNGSGDTVQLEIDDTLVTASAITYEGTPVNMTDYAYGGHEDILQVLGY